MTEILMLAALASFFAFDFAFGQFMISRPIVCASVFGYVMGDIKSGLIIGMIVELLWSDLIHMGASIPANSTAIALLGVYWGIKNASYGDGAFVVSLMIAVPVGVMFREIDITARKINTKISNYAEKKVSLGKEYSIDLAMYSGLFVFFMSAFVFYFAVLFPGNLLISKIMMNIPPALNVHISHVLKLLPVAGFGVIVANFHSKFPWKK